MQDVADLIRQTKAELRPYQQRIITKALDCFTGNKTSVLVEAPTGAGKTVTALLIARLMQDRLGVRVGWVALRRNLLAQAAVENRDLAINVVDLRFISMFSRDLPTGIDLLVIDEFQHDGCSTMANLHSVIRPRFTLGLSATPYRSDSIKLHYDEIIKDAELATLIHEGYLSPYHHYTMANWSPETVASLYAGDRERWGKSLMFFSDLAQCREAKRLLDGHGVRSDVVTASSDRDSQLAAFRTGDLDVLVNCQILTEGANFPDLRTVFCRPACRGLTVQMAGRVLRKYPGLPVKQVVQCLETPWPFTRTARPACQFAWRDGWRSLTPNSQINLVNGRVLRALAVSRVEIPQGLVTQKQAKRVIRPNSSL